MTCMILGVTVLVDMISFGGSQQALAQDCNDNGIEDACDIECGQLGQPCDVPGCGGSADCNGNGVPDECEFPCEAIPPIQGEVRLYADTSLATSGLVGSYVDQRLAGYAAQDDWRVSQTIAGTRIDEVIDFTDPSWGVRATVGLTHGTDGNWDKFSVQWDGYIEVLTSLTRVAMISDDSSRMWIDLNGDEVFDESGSEFLDNNWGSNQAATQGPASQPIESGVYRIRIQYEEDIGGNVARLITIPQPAVRVAYLVPSNRLPQPNAVRNLQGVMQVLQAWYREQMDRNGFGPKSFRYETLQDGVTPWIHGVYLAETDEYLRGDIWGRVNQAAADAGVPIWTPGEMWLLIPEIHLQQSDSAVVGGVALGAGNGSGRGPGVAMIGSALLSFAALSGLSDDRVYDGLVIPGIGPYPLVDDVSFPWFERSTISSVYSSFVGATIHEVTHGFGIAHDFRNDGNFHGNLMGNGLRGMRGAVFPNWYSDDTRLSYAAALALNTSQYFTLSTNCWPGLRGQNAYPDSESPGGFTVVGLGDDKLRRWLGADETSASFPDDQPVPPEDELTDTSGAFPMNAFMRWSKNSRNVNQREDGERPTLTILTGGAVDPVAGQIEIEFEASDNVGLASALLHGDGKTIAELVLSGTSITRKFVTPFYEPGVEVSYEVDVYDTNGNRTGSNTAITPTQGTNRAPRPRFRIFSSRARVGASILLDASDSEDPDHPATSLTVEWDLDGDEAFDTQPTTDKTLWVSYENAGSRLIRVRVIDPAGAQSVSTPIALRVVPDVPLDFNLDGRGDGRDFFVLHACMTGPELGATAEGCDEADLDEDSDVDLLDFALFQQLFTGPCG